MQLAEIINRYFMINSIEQGFCDSAVKNVLRKVLTIILCLKPTLKEGGYPI